ncbi:Facilitated trehalose transporter Tret1 [Chamberlinius hualienensis]
MDTVDTDRISLHSLENEVRHQVESVKSEVSSIVEDIQEDKKEVIEDIRNGIDDSKDVEELRDDIKSLKEDGEDLHKEMADEVEEIVHEVTEIEEVDLVKHELKQSIDKAFAENELKKEIKAEIVNEIVDDRLEGTLEHSAGHSKSLESFAGTSSYNTSEAHLVKEVPKGSDKILMSVVCAVIICLGSFIMGTVIGYPSPAIPNLSIGPGQPFYPDDEQTSWIGSIITLTALFGSLIGGYIMDKIGRKLGLLCIALPMAAGWVLISASPNYGCMLAGRAITGLTMGIISVICPVYLSEISPASIRGVLGSLHQLMICIGILYTYGFGSFLNWQWLVIAILGFLILMSVALIFIVDSPRYLFASGQIEACKESIVWLRGKSVNIDAEISELKEMVESAKDKASFSDFAQPQLWKPLAISVGLMIFQQFSGINVVMFYTVDIFQMANIDMDPNLQTIVVGVVGVVGTLVSVGISDLVGRRILLLASGFLMAISMAGLGTFFYLLNDNLGVPPPNLSWLPITCLVLFNFGFDVAYGPIPWLMMGELFPQRARGLASSIATASNWLCAFIMTKFWTNMIDAMGAYGGYWLCCAFCVASIFFIIIFVPETKGKTLEEIEESFK